jgi:ATP-dependent Clp protease, protease subunit
MKNEFEKFAVNHMGISSMTMHRYTSAINNNFSNVTPYIIEERQLNVAQMDVFSRLMMDRIIFMGTAIDSYVANMT